MWLRRGVRIALGVQRDADNIVGRHERRNDKVSLKLSDGHGDEEKNKRYDISKCERASFDGKISACCRSLPSIFIKLMKMSLGACSRDAFSIQSLINPPVALIGHHLALNNVPLHPRPMRPSLNQWQTRHTCARPVPHHTLRKTCADTF